MSNERRGELYESEVEPGREPRGTTDETIISVRMETLKKSKDLSHTSYTFPTPFTRKQLTVTLVLDGHFYWMLV